MEYYNIALLVFITFLVSLDFIDLEVGTKLANFKENQEARYLLVLVASVIVLYTEDNKGKLPKNPPSYEESVSTF